MAGREPLQWVVLTNERGQVREWTSTSFDLAKLVHLAILRQGRTAYFYHTSNPCREARALGIEPRKTPLK